MESTANTGVLDGHAPAASWDFSQGDEITPATRAIALLGDGRRTETWLAWEVERWAPVTVKICRPDHLGSQRTVDGLRREADAHRTFEHPAIRGLLDDGIDTPRPHLVMEYIQGPALDDCLDRGAFHPVDVIRIGLQLGSVLHFLHTRGSLYLDMKPQNAILYAGHAVLIDLGFVRPIGWTADDGVARGSRPYMAPEQCRCETLTPSTDLFGLGTVLYEIATGEPAYRSDGDWFEQLERRAACPREKATTLSARVFDVIDALLEPDPANRPATAADALLALDAALPENQDPMWPDFVTPLLATGSTAPRP